MSHFIQSVPWRYLPHWFAKEMFRRFRDKLVETSNYFFVKDAKTGEEGKKEGDLDIYYCYYRSLFNLTKRTLCYVTFNKIALPEICMCRMFEHLGLLCRHITDTSWPLWIWNKFLKFSVLSYCDGGKCMLIE